MSFNDNLDALHDCIYGGPIPLDALKQQFAAAGLDYPLLTTVQREEDYAPRWNGWDFRPGDGLVYRTIANGAGRGEEWRAVHTPEQWQWSLQQRILELRRRGLPLGAIQVRAEDESRLRQLALGHCQSSRADWREAVALWADAVLLRTQRKIHDAQRTFLAFVLAGAEPLETIGVVGHQFHHALRQLLASFTPEGLRYWLGQGLEIAQTQLTQQQRRLDNTMRMALAHMQAHAAEPLSLDAVAVHVGMSAAAFSRKFKATMGQTFTVYVQSLRLELASALLLRTDRTVLAVALDCGFGSVEQFHRVFRQRLGMTPLAYRRGRR